MNKNLATRLLDESPDAVIAVTLARRVTYWSHGAEKILSCASAETIGRDLNALIIPVDCQTEEQRILDSAIHGEVAAYESLCRRKDGTDFSIEINLSPLETEEVTLVSSAIRDVTNHKLFERTLREKNAELEAANQELESFSNSISHDLRAPLQGMAGFSRMLREDHGTEALPAAHRLLGRVETNATKLGELVDGLLMFSRLGRQLLKKQPVAPTEIVRRVLEDLEAEQAGRPAEIRVAELPRCEADPTLLQQVFTNLLSNAFKYTRHTAAALIEVGCRNGSPLPVYYVKDNGAGFEMQYAGKLFGVFQRLHREEQFEGTGVGLAIVHRIVQRHGGRIWAESKVDRGATFFFTLGGGDGSP